MKQKGIQIGLVGAGARLRRVVQLLTQNEDGIKVSAVFDPSAEAIDHVHRLWGNQVEVAASVPDLLSQEGVEWVFVGSRNCDHAENVTQALEAGRSVFCEKPLATSVEDCLQIRDALKDSEATFAYGLVLRYSPFYRTLKEILDSGSIGKVISFEFNETISPDHGGYIFGNWRRSCQLAGSHLLEKCCHDLDLANWLIGSLPVRVSSFGGRRFFVPENQELHERFGKKHGKSLFEQWPDPARVDAFSEGADILDHQVAILEYANGIRAAFHTNCCVSIKERRFYICGTLGTLRADMITGMIELRRHGFDTFTEVRDSGFRGGHGGGDQLMATELRDTLMEGVPPAAGLEEALCSNLSALAIDLAADSGAVVDLRPWWGRAGIKI